jgi:tRNA(fMet)-specific endonuclease VapC
LGTTSDWAIDHLRQVDPVSKKLEELAPEGLALSVVSLAEIYEGVYYSRDPQRSKEVLNSFLSPDLEILGIDQEIAQIFGRERGRLRKEGKLIGDMDLLIASTALRQQLTLLSDNRRHFEAVEGLDIISI